MKKLSKVSIVLVIALIGGIMIAADHIDAPAVQGGTSDVTDFYVFQGADTDNLVFVANLQGLLSPSATSSAAFDENVLVEFNIDTDGDAIEDLVIQAIPDDSNMYVYGPYAPTQTGLLSTVNMDNGSEVVVAITPYGDNAITATNDNVTAFAGPRDDPFFMDFAQYSEIIAGNATSFNNPGADTFAGTNVLSIVVEVPKSLVGGSGTINTWVETKRKQ